MNKLIAGGIYKIEVPKITPSVHTSNKDWDEEFCKLRQVESVQQKKQFTKTIAQYCIHEIPPTKRHVQPTREIWLNRGS